MEKKHGDKGGSNKNTSSAASQKAFGTNKLQVSQEDASRLIGSVIEKGISEKPQNMRFSRPPPAPKPTVLPFPVARHRSHGPHWNSLSDMHNNDDNNDNEDDDEDVYPIAAFANPVQRKQKKGLDFSRWKELITSHDSSASKKTGENVSSVGATEKQTKSTKEIKTAEKRNTSRDPTLADEDVFVPKEMDMEYDSNISLPENKTEVVITSGSGFKFVDSVVGMELDERSKLQHPENVEDGSSSARPVNKHGAERMSIDDFTEAHFEKMETGLPGMLKKRERKSSTATAVFSSRCDSIGNEQGSVSLESEIDAENRVRLQSMSPDEIAEAQAEIMEKMNPALLNLLKKRGQDKLKKQKCSSPVMDNNIVKPDNALNEHQTIRDAKEQPQLGISPSQRVEDNSVVQKSGQAGGSLWNAWSKRVEVVRELRFSLDGFVISHDFFPKSETGDNSAQISLRTSSVGERDYLRTDGDPDAAGYTIKEALSLTRSAVPGQRALALRLLASVLDRALHSIYQNQVGHTLRCDNKLDRSTDWEAVWAYAFGPEPELVLSLRMSLDDDHNSVVLQCLRVLHCALSCDFNEYFFDISEKTAILGKDIFTAPVFRSKPEIGLGFLHGGYWKYSAKPSNILPLSEDIMDDEAVEKRTIQDDIFVAGQDFAAGLVRMGILPRFRCLLETDATMALEECIISLLIAIARHLPTCTNEIMKCERLVQAVVQKFTMNNNAEVKSSKIKSVCFLKVLARSDKKNCLEFIKNGTFQAMTWHLYQSVSSLEQWLKLGRENCKISSGLMIEQLRFWKVCIQNGYCVSYFPAIFPSLCLWLNPPSIEKLTESNVLSEFAAISAEVYLVLEALAARLPNFYSQEQPEYDDDTETWSWSNVGPMLDSAIKWLALKSSLYASKYFERHKGTPSQFVFQDLTVSPLLWVYSAIMHFLTKVLERVIPEDSSNLHGSRRQLPWLPEFVPKVGLEIIKNGFFSFLDDANKTGKGTNIAPCCSFFEELCHFRQTIEYETSLASVSCLYGLVQVIVTVDNLIRLAKSGIPHPTSQGYSFSKEEKILEEGILKGSLVELRSVLEVFVGLVTSECHFVQSIEMFGRGGPAPGVGLGWGASGGGFWSKTVLLAQTDARLLIHLLEIFQMASISELPKDEEMNFAVHIVDSALGVCLSAGPRDKVIVDKALDILLQVPVLKSLNILTCRFLQSSGKMKVFAWEYEEEEYLHFSKTLTSHFKKRWLGVKRKSKATVGNSTTGNKTFKKGSVSLDTIPEDLDQSNTESRDHTSASLTVEWAHQRLPLPMHWFLSPISTISYGKHDGLQSTSKILNYIQDAHMLEVAKAGLPFLLGIEAMAFFRSSKIPSPVQTVPLFWKFHSLSVALLAGMGVLEEEKSRDVFEALQVHYGLLLDEAWSSRCGELVSEENVNLLPKTEENYNIEFLMFKSEIHESYSIFIETLVEQLAAISFGDLVYGRQVAVYLHRCVEAPVRLAAWNALYNARALELLPPLQKCVAKAEGYLHPIEDNEEILEAYVKSWTAGVLDRAASRGSMAFTLVLHHLSSFIFFLHASDNFSLRNKLVKSLLRDYSRQQRHERMMLDLIRYTKPSTSQMLEQIGVSSLQPIDVEKRFEVLREACEGNSSLLIEVEKLKSSHAKN